MLTDLGRRLSWLAVCVSYSRSCCQNLGLPALLFETGDRARNGREIVWIGLGILMLLWITRVERLPLSSVGSGRTQWSTLGWGVACDHLLMANRLFSFALYRADAGLSQTWGNAAIVQFHYGCSS